MKLSKRIISLALTLIMLLGTVTALPIGVSAKTADLAEVGGYDTSYTLTGNGAADMVAIASKQLWKSGSSLGYYSAWCDAFVIKCAELAGQSAAIPNKRGCWNLYSAILNAGGYTVSSPQAGDIIFYTCTKTGGMCHVGIMTDSINSIQGNVINQVYNLKYTAYLDENYTNASDACWTATFVRPNYKSAAVDPFQGKTPVNLGSDFYASILKSDTGVYLHASNHNVQLADNNNLNDLSHIWHFVRQSDGSYLIINCEDSSALTVADKGTSAGTNIETLMNLDYDSQRWIIYKNGENQYVFKPKHCSLAMDVSNNSSAYGNNIIAYTYNGSTAQLFNIETLPNAATPTLSVKAGDYKTKTEFSFESDDSTVYYNLVINSGTKGEVTEYKTIPLIQNNLFMYELPVGYYEAYAEAYNGYSTTKGNTVSFHVTGEPVVGEDGWTYSDKLYEEITPDLYDIEYLNIYDEIATEAPGEDWIKGELAKTEYVNSGEPYWSNIELTTSDTRVLVNYIYYHYCSGSTGLEANYEATSTFAHYDWLSKDNVYEQSVANDYADSRYKFYHLKFNDGSDAYCSSGVSCDGSFGAHSGRSYYWYKSCEYQDLAAVSYYHYTKESTWQKTEDITASDVTYRYKLKDADATTPTTEPDTNTTAPTTPDTPQGLLGDVNRDGKVNVRDATAIQKYLAKMIKTEDLDLTVADFDQNGKVNVKDATNIQKKIAGLI